MTNLTTSPVDKSSSSSSPPARGGNTSPPITHAYGARQITTSLISWGNLPSGSSAPDDIEITHADLMTASVPPPPIEPVTTTSSQRTLQQVLSDPDLDLAMLAGHLKQAGAADFTGKEAEQLARQAPALLARHPGQIDSECAGNWCHLLERLTPGPHAARLLEFTAAVLKRTNVKMADLTRIARRFSRMPADVRAAHPDQSDALHQWLTNQATRFTTGLKDMGVTQGRRWSEEQFRKLDEKGVGWIKNNVLTSQAIVALLSTLPVGRRTEAGQRLMRTVQIHAEARLRILGKKSAATKDSRLTSVGLRDCLHALSGQRGSDDLLEILCGYQPFLQGADADASSHLPRGVLLMEALLAARGRTNLPGVTMLIGKLRGELPARTLDGRAWNTMALCETTIEHLLRHQERLRSDGRGTRLDLHHLSYPFARWIVRHELRKLNHHGDRSGPLRIICGKGKTNLANWGKMRALTLAVLREPEFVHLPWEIPDGNDGCVNVGRRDGASSLSAVPKVQWQGNLGGSNEGDKLRYLRRELSRNRDLQFGDIARLRDESLTNEQRCKLKRQYFGRHANDLHKFLEKIRLMPDKDFGGLQAKQNLQAVVEKKLEEAAAYLHQHINELGHYLHDFDVVHELCVNTFSKQSSKDVYTTAAFDVAELMWRQRGEILPAMKPISMNMLAGGFCKWPNDPTIRQSGRAILAEVRDRLAGDSEDKKAAFNSRALSNLGNSATAWLNWLGDDAGSEDELVFRDSVVVLLNETLRRLTEPGNAARKAQFDQQELSNLGNTASAWLQRFGATANRKDVEDVGKCVVALLKTARERLTGGGEEQKAAFQPQSLSNLGNAAKAWLNCFGEDGEHEKDMRDVSDVAVTLLNETRRRLTEPGNDARKAVFKPQPLSNLASTAMMWLHLCEAIANPGEVEDVLKCVLVLLKASGEMLTGGSDEQKAAFGEQELSDLSKAATAWLRRFGATANRQDVEDVGMCVVALLKMARERLTSGSKEQKAAFKRHALSSLSAASKVWLIRFGENADDHEREAVGKSVVALLKAVRLRLTGGSEEQKATFRPQELAIVGITATAWLQSFGENADMPEADRQEVRDGMAALLGVANERLTTEMNNAPESAFKSAFKPLHLSNLGRTAMEWLQTFGEDGNKKNAGEVRKSLVTLLKAARLRLTEGSAREKAAFDPPSFLTLSIAATAWPRSLGEDADENDARDVRDGMAALLETACARLRGGDAKQKAAFSPECLLGLSGAAQEWLQWFGKKASTDAVRAVEGNLSTLLQAAHARLADAAADPDADGASWTVRDLRRLVYVLLQSDGDRTPPPLLGAIADHVAATPDVLARTDLAGLASFAVPLGQLPGMETPDADGDDNAGDDARHARQLLRAIAADLRAHPHKIAQAGISDISTLLNAFDRAGMLAEIGQPFTPDGDAAMRTLRDLCLDRIAQLAEHTRLHAAELSDITMLCRALVSFTGIGVPRTSRKRVLRLLVGQIQPLLHRKLQLHFSRQGWNIPGFTDGEMEPRARGEGWKTDDLSAAIYWTLKTYTTVTPEWSKSTLRRGSPREYQARRAELDGWMKQLFEGVQKYVALDWENPSMRMMAYLGKLRHRGDGFETLDRHTWLHDTEIRRGMANRNVQPLEYAPDRVFDTLQHPPRKPPLTAGLTQTRHYKRNGQEIVRDTPVPPRYTTLARFTEEQYATLRFVQLPGGRLTEDFLERLVYIDGEPYRLEAGWAGSRMNSKKQGANSTGEGGAHGWLLAMRLIDTLQDTATTRWSRQAFANLQDYGRVQRAWYPTPELVPGCISHDHVLEGRFDIEIVAPNTPFPLKNGENGENRGDLVVGDGICYMREDVAEQFGFWKHLDKAKVVGGNKPTGNLPSQALQHLPRDDKAAKEIRDRLKAYILPSDTSDTSDTSDSSDSSDSSDILVSGKTRTAQRTASTMPTISPTSTLATLMAKPTVASTTSTTSIAKPKSTPMPLDVNELYRAVTGGKVLGHISIAVPTAHCLVLPRCKSAYFDEHPDEDVLLGRPPYDSLDNLGVIDASRVRTVKHAAGDPTPRFLDECHGFQFSFFGREETNETANEATMAGAPPNYVHAKGVVVVVKKEWWPDDKFTSPIVMYDNIKAETARQGGQRPPGTFARRQFLGNFVAVNVYGRGSFEGVPVDDQKQKGGDFDGDEDLLLTGLPELARLVKQTQAAQAAQATHTDAPGTLKPEKKKTPAVMLRKTPEGEQQKIYLWSRASYIRRGKVKVLEDFTNLQAAYLAQPDTIKSTLDQEITMAAYEGVPEETRKLVRRVLGEEWESDDERARLLGEVAAGLRELHAGTRHPAARASLSRLMEAFNAWQSHALPASAVIDCVPRKDAPAVETAYADYETLFARHDVPAEEENADGEAAEDDEEDEQTAAASRAIDTIEKELAHLGKPLRDKATCGAYVAGDPARTARKLLTAGIKQGTDKLKAPDDIEEFAEAAAQMRKAFVRHKVPLHVPYTRTAERQLTKASFDPQRESALLDDNQTLSAHAMQENIKLLDKHGLLSDLHRTHLPKAPAVKGKYRPELNAITTELLEQAQEMAESIVPCVDDALHAAKATQAGVGDRIKSEWAIKDKLFKSKANKAEMAEWTLAEASGVVYDLLRFVAVLREDSFLGQFNTILEVLEENGIRLTYGRSTMHNGTQYKGAHATFENAAGKAFEIQFHTAATHEAKKRTHPPYKLLNGPNTLSDKERAENEAYIARIQGEVKIPAHLEQLPNYPSGQWESFWAGLSEQDLLVPTNAERKNTAAGKVDPLTMQAPKQTVDERCRTLAADKVKRAREMELRITELMRAVLGEALIDADDRIRPEQEVKNKILARRTRDTSGNARRPETAAAHVKNTLRYVAVWEESGFAERIATTLQALARQGFKADGVWHQFINGKPYMGWHVILRHPDRGDEPFELQLHTPASHAAKTACGDMYRRMLEPKSTLSDEKKKSIKDQQIIAFAGVKTPAGLERFATIEGVRAAMGETVSKTALTSTKSSTKPSTSASSSPKKSIVSDSSVRWTSLTTGLRWCHWDGTAYQDAGDHDAPHYALELSDGALIGCYTLPESGRFYHEAQHGTQCGVASLNHFNWALTGQAGLLIAQQRMHAFIDSYYADETRDQRRRRETYVELDVLQKFNETFASQGYPRAVHGVGALQAGTLNLTAASFNTHDVDRAEVLLLAYRHKEDESAYHNLTLVRRGTAFLAYDSRRQNPLPLGGTSMSEAVVDFMQKHAHSNSDESGPLQGEISLELLLPAMSSATTPVQSRQNEQRLETHKEKLAKFKNATKQVKEKLLSRRVEHSEKAVEDALQMKQDVEEMMQTVADLNQRMDNLTRQMSSPKTIFPPPKEDKEDDDKDDDKTSD
jgi:hypothetical protein